MKSQKTDRHERLHYRTKLGAGLVLLSLAGVLEAAASDPVERLSSPAGEESLTPFLAGSSTGLHMSWLEKKAEGHLLRYSRWDGARFTEPASVRASDKFFANWADFGSVLPFGDGRLAAHWIQKSAGGTYEYDVFVSISEDG